MALQKQFNFKGVVCDYWKIISYREDRVTNKTTSVIGLYKDQVSRGESVRNFVLEMTKIMDGVGLTLADQYENYKLMPEFEGSVDLI